nr:uncharacterized protein LOC113735512 [Coffea arabica]
MSLVVAHDIVVRYNGRGTRIPNVDLGKYSYIELLNDVCEKALHKLPGNLNYLLHMRCGISRSATTMDVNTDKAVMEMFKVHDNELVINLFVDHMDVILFNMPEVNNNNNFGGGQENLGIEETTGNVEPNLQNIERDDEVFISSDDDSWLYEANNDKEDSLSNCSEVHESFDRSDIAFSDYEVNDEGDIILNSESEEEIDPNRAALRATIFTYNPREDIEFEKNMLFTNVDAFRPALKDYAIQKGFPIVRLKNEKKRCTAKCAVESCPWRIHASPIGETTTFQIKSYTSQHTCVMNNRNAEATSDWIAKKLVPLLWIHPQMNTESVYAKIVSNMVCIRARCRFGKQRQGPNLLAESRFLRIFISFKAQKDGYLRYSKPFVGFDGCHLKGPYGGMLLTVVALDRNNSIRPLAIAMAECENKETRSWFFHFSEEYSGPFDSQLPLTFMSDRKMAVKSFDAAGHKEAMERIKEINIETWKYMTKISLTAWAMIMVIHMFSCIVYFIYGGFFFSFANTIATI